MTSAGWARCPSHPELLDWLAVEFRESGGSLKQLHRLIVTSAVYRQCVRQRPEVRRASTPTTSGSGGRTAAGSTPNRVHDAILALAGRLDPTMGGPSVQQFALRPGRARHAGGRLHQLRLGQPRLGPPCVYRFLFRTLPDPFFDALDAADASQLTAVAQRVDHAAPGARAAQQSVRPPPVRALRRPAAPGIADAWTTRCGSPSLAAYGRTAGSEELSLLAHYAARHGLVNLCRLIFNSNEFLFVN